MKGLFKRDGNKLVPAGESGEAILHSIPQGGEVYVSVSAQRTSKQLNLLWAMCQVVAENLEEEVEYQGKKVTMHFTKEKVMSRMKIKTGYCEERVTEGGTVYYTPLSISYDEMSDKEFKIFMEKAQQCLSEMLGVSVEELLKESKP